MIRKTKPEKATFEAASNEIVTIRTVKLFELQIAGFSMHRQFSAR